jgi:hypothetical protein
MSTLSIFQRMRRLYPLKPLVKKSPVEDRHRLRKPQFDGRTGWILLSQDSEGTAQCLFVDKSEKPESLSIILDERVFSDTVMRVVRISKDVFLVYDLKTLNGVSVFETQNYERRQETLRGILEMFHHPDLTALVLPEDAPAGTILRGYEYYDDQPGTLGAFLPAEE